MKLGKVEKGQTRVGALSLEERRPRRRDCIGSRGLPQRQRWHLPPELDHLPIYMRRLATTRQPFPLSSPEHWEHGDSLQLLDPPLTRCSTRSFSSSHLLQVDSSSCFWRVLKGIFVRRRAISCSWVCSVVHRTSRRLL